MGLIILQSQIQQRATFYATKVQPYHTTGVMRGHIDAIIMAAICLPAALHCGSEDIVVEPKGEMPKRFTVKFVIEAIRRNPRKFAGWLPQPPQSQAARLRDASIRRRMQSLPGGILLG